MKFIVVSGGVVSGLGKGITASSIGVLLKECDLNVTHIKIDPYLNIDAGVLSPYEHGEVFVLDDGGEVDLDLGNYERFSQVRLTRDHNLTTGKVYQQTINKERKGDYLGKTVQLVPHVTDAIQSWIERVANIPVSQVGSKSPDVCVIELGGTVGDIESMLFLESLRQFRYRVGGDNFCHVHVSLVPTVGAGDGEQKSKPTQHGVRELRAAGLQPDIIICRSALPLTRATTAKISMFCMVPATHVLSIHDVSNLYKVPLLMLEQRVASLILNCLKINCMPPLELPIWQALSDKVENPEDTVTIGIVGKYTGLTDSYLSVTKSLFHAAIHLNLKLKIEWIESTKLEDEHSVKSSEEHKSSWAAMKACDGILIPGGFGDRGVQGKIAAAHYARINKIPYLGICLGMQVAVIEYARNVLKLPEANSSEFNPETVDPVIIFMPEISTTHMGATMRLGSRPTDITTGTLAWQLYGQQTITARHRHRYEVNPDYVDRFEKAGLNFTGKDSDKGVRMEIVELPADKHDFYFGTQYHPEYTSSPFKPSPPFRGLVKAAAKTFSRHPHPSPARSPFNSPEREEKEEDSQPAQKKTKV